MFGIVKVTRHVYSISKYDKRIRSSKNTVHFTYIFLQYKENSFSNWTMFSVFIILIKIDVSRIDYYEIIFWRDEMKLGIRQENT